jgi:protocatechuate 3,4-dioxygenase beta subunit
MVLRMPRGSTLRIHAVLVKPDAPQPRPGAAPEGDPVADAQIVVYNEEMSAYVMGKTNAQGFVELPGMPAGDYVVNGMAKGVVSASEVNMKVDKNQLVQEETIEFDPAVETTVEVVDEAGRPLAGVEFFGVNNEDRYDVLRSAKFGVTDAEGKVKCVFEASGPRSAAFGFKPGFAVVHAVPDVTDDESSPPIHLVAKKPITVHGVVKSSDGRPIPDAVVTVNVAASTEQESTDSDMELEVRADAQGRYTLPFLPRSENITVTGASPDGSSQMDEDVELKDGTSDYTLDISMELDDASDAAAAAGGKKK